MVTIPVNVPADFQFQAAVESHGWYQLAPFSYDRERALLTRRIRLQGGKLATMQIRASKSRAVLVDLVGPQVISSIERNQVIQIVRRIFGLERDLRPFYALMSHTRNYEWVDEHKAARLLTCPTVWEDLVKTLLTTNTSWNNTRDMVARVVALDPDGLFPNAQRLLSLSESELAEQTGTGYRAPYLRELAERIVGGLDVEAWYRLPSDDLYRAVIDLSGFGDYAAGTMLRLLGHYDRLAIDSVARKAFERLSGNAPASDASLRAYYEKFGEWRGLVLWMDCIRDDFNRA